MDGVGVHGMRRETVDEYGRGRELKKAVTFLEYWQK